MIDINFLKNQFEQYNKKLILDSGELFAFDKNLSKKEYRLIKQKFYNHIAKNS